MTYLPVDILIDQKTKQRHRIDTLNLLAYVCLLVLVLVTTWFFKRRANKCHLHETGLAIIYGLVMGAGLRYFGLEVTISSIPLEDKLPRTAPADYITILTHNTGDKNISQRHLYAYEFRGEIHEKTKLGSQISYASVDPEVFFNIILPPIVLNAGLSLKRRHFFRNIGAIFSYAFLGTSVSVATVGAIIFASVQALKHLANQSYLADQFGLANCLYFGAIISPTDPLAVLAIFQELGVDVNLFALVFGESILNDAVSIVLTHSIDHFSVIYGRDPYYSVVRILAECLCNFAQMFLASCAIGILFGVVTAVTTKFTKLTESPLLESSLVVLMSYSSFLSAEVLDTSGIVAILMCGITQAHYTINNLSFEARDRLKSLFELLTFLCENFLFLAVGVCFWQRGQTWEPSFIGIAFVAVVVARALSVYPLSALLNLGRRHKIPTNYQHLIAWGGAARGVISYSLAARNTVGDARRIMLSTTSVIVIVSVIAVGGAVAPLLSCLRIPFGPKAKQQRAAGAKPPLEPLSGADDDEDDGHGAAYHATNNPAWLVRPKRLHSLRWHGCQQQQQTTRIANESLLVVGADSLLGLTPTTICCGPRHLAPVRGHLHSNRRGQARCGGHFSAGATPVLEIEVAPAVGSTSCVASRRCACECLLDSRTTSYSSACHDHGQLATASSALAQLPAPSAAPPPPPPTLVAEEPRGELHPRPDADGDGAASDAMHNDSRTSSTLALATSNANPGREVVQFGPATNTDLANEQHTNNNIDGPYDNASLVRRWRNIDNRFIKPLLTNSQPTLLETMPSSLRAVARLLTSDEQLMRQQS